MGSIKLSGGKIFQECFFHFLGPRARIEVTLDAANKFKQFDSGFDGFRRVCAELLARIIQDTNSGLQAFAADLRTEVTNSGFLVKGNDRNSKGGEGFR